jgi:uncharacterized membrane protein
MSNLTVLTFTSAEGAQNLSDVLWTADEDGLIEIEDLAIVRRDVEGAPKMWQAVQPEGGRRSVLSGAFWGLTLGTLFVMPLAGAVTGAVVGMTSGHIHDFGIDDDFIEQVRDQLTPDTSAIFILGSATDLGALRERIQHVDFEITSTELDPEREAELRAMFEQD